MFKVNSYYINRHLLFLFTLNAMYRHSGAYNAMYNVLMLQICCMRFLNSLLTTAPSSNARVFLQEELELAGVDTNVLLLVSTGDFINIM